VHLFSWKEQFREGLTKGARSFHIVNATLTPEDSDAFSPGFASNALLERLRGLLVAEPSHRGWRDICFLAPIIGPVGVEYATEHLRERWPEPWNALDASSGQLTELYFDDCHIEVEAWRALLSSPLVGGVAYFGVRASNFAGAPMKRFLEDPWVTRNLERLIITRQTMTFEDLERLGQSPATKTIRELSLPHNAIDDVALQGLRSAPPSRMKRLSSLDLSGNPIKAKGVNFLIGWGRLSGRSINNLFMDCDTLSSAAIRKLSDNFNLYASHALMKKMYKTDLVSLVYNFDAQRSVNVNADKATIADAFFDTYDAYWDMGCGSTFDGPGWK